MDGKIVTWAMYHGQCANDKGVPYIFVSYTWKKPSQCLLNVDCLKTPPTTSGSSMAGPRTASISFQLQKIKFPLMQSYSLSFAPLWRHSQGDILNLLVTWTHKPRGEVLNFHLIILIAKLKWTCFYWQGCRLCRSFSPPIHFVPLFGLNYHTARPIFG